MREIITWQSEFRKFRNKIQAIKTNLEKQDKINVNDDELHMQKVKNK